MGPAKRRDFPGRLCYLQPMQGDSPESDPFLQRSVFGSRIATGHVEPCILYLEATEAGEVPLLFACWARVASEVRDVGDTIRLKLGDVIILVGKPLKSLQGWSMQDGKTSWNFASYSTKEIQLRRDASGWALKGFPNLCYPQSSSAYGYQGSLKFLDKENDSLLLKLRSSSSSTSRPFIQKVLELAPVEWPSLINARAFLQIVSEIAPKLQHRRQSFLHQIISTVFKQKKLERV
jgi:hypothetical protein